MRALPTRHRRGRALRWSATALAAGLVAVGCTGDDDETTATTVPSTTTTTTVPRQDDGTLKIGIYLPVTGAGSELGQPMIEAVESAVTQINLAGGVLGNRVETVSADEGAGTGMTELLSEGVDAIVGPASSLNAVAQLGPAVDAQSGVVVCSPTATSLLLDDYPDNTFFFRTVPSDSLQMAAIARQVQRTGARTVAVGYLDDPYGRGLRDAFRTEAAARDLDITEEAGFSADQTDLSDSADTLLAAEPGLIVVLGDSDDGGRLLAALDAAGERVPSVIVNDAIRQARQTIQSLSDDFRPRVAGVAPLARTQPSGADDDAAEDSTEGFFTAHATDCVNLIALSVVAAGTDAPRVFRTNMAGVSADGSPCTTFEECSDLLDRGLNIDYDGASGSVELSNATGDPVRARFESFSFDEDGTEIRSFPFDVP